MYGHRPSQRLFYLLKIYGWWYANICNRLFPGYGCRTGYYDNAFRPSRNLSSIATKPVFLQLIEGSLTTVESPTKSNLLNMVPVLALNHASQ